MQILCESGKTVSQLAAEISRYPQELINVSAPHDYTARKALISSAPLQEAIAQGEAQLAGDGRILVRASGTEALIRVMVEASTENAAQDVARMVASTVENLQK